MGHLRDHTSATKHFKFSLGGLQDAHEVEREREHRLQSRPVLRPPRAQPSAAWHEPYRCSGVCECHEEGPLGVTLVATEEPTERGPWRCYAGLDLGRKRLDVSLLMVDVWSLRRPLLPIRMGCARLVERVVPRTHLRRDRGDETRSVVHDPSCSAGGSRSRTRRRSKGLRHWPARRTDRRRAGYHTNPAPRKPVDQSVHYF